MKKLLAVIWFVISIAGIVYSYMKFNTVTNSNFYEIAIFVLILQTIILSIYMRMIYVAKVRLNQYKTKEQRGEG